MYKGINIITNKSLGFKLMNSISFGESVFSAGFNLKTAKEDLNIKGKYGFPPRHLRGKVLEGPRSHITEAEGETPLGGVGWPPPSPPISHLRGSVSHRL